MISIKYDELGNIVGYWDDENHAWVSQEAYEAYVASITGEEAPATDEDDSEEPELDEDEE